MEKFLAPVKPLPPNPKPQRRNPWKRSVIELNGRIDAKYRHDVSSLLMDSYSEIGAFPHLYHFNRKQCQTHLNQLGDGVNSGHPLRKQGISAVEFDSKGVYLASVTKSGCLTVHDFESLYCQSNDSLPCLKEDESKHVLHLPQHRQLDSVKWNPANQDEVACISVKSNEVLIFDIGYISSKPVEVLQTRHTLSILGTNVHRGLCDIAFTTTHDPRVVASDTHGVLNVWDRRANILPCIELPTASRSIINSIQVNVENQIIFGAGGDGIVYMWDLRGGRSSGVFQTHKEGYHTPLTAVEIAPMLGRIRSLKAQSKIAPKEIHAISLNPSCPYQLAFHLDDGWSGVLDVFNYQVTHVHCPPPAWLNDTHISSDLLYLRKPSWIPASSIYVVGSLSDSGIHMLDFYPNSSSPSHVDFNEDMQNISEINHQEKRNKFLPLSEGVTSCAVHPLNNTVIAGTKNSSLLVVSQRHESLKADVKNEDPSTEAIENFS